MDAGNLWMMLQSAVGQTGEAAKGITGEDLRFLARMVGAGLAMIGVAGAGVGIGNAAGAAAQGVARNPQANGPIMRILLVGAAMAESTAIYALVVALLLLFVM